MADDAKREALRKILGPEGVAAPHGAKFFYQGWDAGAAHERAKYTALVDEAAQRHLATEATLETTKETVRAEEGTLAAALAEIGGDDGQGNTGE